MTSAAASATGPSRDAAGGSASRAGVLAALRRLDVRLADAVSAARRAYGPDAEHDRFRGLYVTGEAVERALDLPPAGAPFALPAEAIERALDAAAEPAFARLAERFTLSPFDLDVLLIALAPDVDLRYERVYAYLQDDVTRKRPTVDLALSLLCGRSADARLRRRSNFAADAPLLQGGVLHLLADPSHPDAPLLARTLRADDQIIAMLLDERGIDRRVLSFCRLEQPDALLPDWPGVEALPPALRDLPAEPVTVYAQATAGADPQATAAALARDRHKPLLIVDVPRMLAEPGFDVTVDLVCREATRHDAVVLFDDVDVLRSSETQAPWHTLLARLARHGGLVLLTGTRRWSGERHGLPSVVIARVEPPDYSTRRRVWTACLSRAGLHAPAGAADVVAARFRLSAAQIRQAVAELARSTAPSAGGLTPRALCAAARAQTSAEFTDLARKVKTTPRWADLVLPETATTQLEDICNRLIHAPRVLEEWGFAGHLTHVTGTSALFAGPSGTGKTMAAAIIAAELELELYKVDLSAVVSKYIGETEKNLARVFALAEDSNAILFFDECDALFGRRSEVRDSHDRYANVEIAYLLQRIEEYSGLAILATNLRHHIDDAFLRRFDFIVTFPFPDEARRRRIWQVLVPPDTPRGHIDWDLLARQYQVSGGSIRNIVLDAAYLAAAAGAAVEMTHLHDAARRECQKIGRPFTPCDAPPPAGVAA